MENKQAKIFGYILGDGWLDVNDRCGVSGEMNSLENIKADIIEVFNEEGKMKTYTRETYSEKYNIYGISSQFNLSKKTSIKIKNLGMPNGRRPETDYSLPEWIINGDYDTKMSFISGYYSAEGLIPSLQTNRKTPRPLTFSFTKRMYLLESSNRLEYQFGKILDDIGCKYSVDKVETFTKDLSIRKDFIINNSEHDFINILSNMRLDYAMDKEEERTNLLIYFNMKSMERDKIIEVYNNVVEERRVNNTSYVKLAEMFNLSKCQVEKIFNGRMKCKLVRNFPKYDQTFKDLYCSTKTPLNGEVPITKVNPVPSFNSNIKIASND